MLRVQYTPENCNKETSCAGTIYGADQEMIARGLPQQRVVNYWRSTPFLRQGYTNDYAAEGLYEGRSLDWQTARASRPRFAPTPVFTPLPAELFDETPATVHVTARIYDGELPKRD